MQVTNFVSKCRCRYSLVLKSASKFKIHGYHCNDLANTHVHVVYSKNKVINKPILDQYSSSNPPSLEQCFGGCEPKVKKEVRGDRPISEGLLTDNL